MVSAFLAILSMTYFLPLETFAAKPGWILRQNSQTYGFVKTIVSPDGIRLDMGDMKVGIRPPDWRVTFWNQRTKFMFDESIEEFKARVPKKNIQKGWKTKVETVKPLEETYSGIKAKHYRWVEYDPNNPKNFFTLYDYACADNLGLPKRLMEVASICCYVPAGKGLPLRVTGGRQVVYLYTTLASKTMVDPAIFKAPKGYTRVKSEMEVLMKEPGLAKEQEVSDLFKAIPGK